MPAPRQRALGFVIEGEGNYREPQHRASWPSTFQSRDCAPTHPREICSARSLRSTCDCSISEAASRMGISRQSLHPGSPPQSRAVRWRGAPSPAGRGNRSRSRRRAPQWRRWEPGRARPLPRRSRGRISKLSQRAKNRKFADPVLERDGFEPSVLG